MLSNRFHKLSHSLPEVSKGKQFIRQDFLANFFENIKYRLIILPSDCQIYNHEHWVIVKDPLSTADS
jgi:hypothetical protein